jgi:tocopherol O-methyltransferase
MIRPDRPETTAAVAAHYDDLDPFYREVWGEHVHHGYWATGRESPKQATDALADLVADRLGLEAGATVCDIGCGYGATAQRVAERHGAHLVGLTVSAAQAAMAAARVPAGGSLVARHGDWLANGLPDGVFDAAYAIESTEHMEDLRRFFAEAARTIRPGGRLAVCAWLASPEPRPWQVRWLLEPICREGRLAGLGDAADYRRLAAEAGFTAVRFEDVSGRVSRTWSICTRRLAAAIITRPRYRRFLLDTGASNRVFAITLLRILLAYRTGAMRYGLFLFARPLVQEQEQP